MWQLLSVLAVPDSHVTSTNAATQDADDNEAGCFLSLLFKTGRTQLATIHTTIRDRAKVSLTFHSLSFVIRLTLEVLTFAQAAECIYMTSPLSVSCTAIFNGLMISDQPGRLHRIELAQLE